MFSSFFSSPVLVVNPLSPRTHLSLYDNFKQAAFSYNFDF